MKNFNQKLFSATVSMLMTVTICQVATTQASDIDIYRPATTGQTRIMFVLDTSASMKASFAKYACDAPVADDLVTVSSTGENSGTIPSYTRYYCTVNSITEEISPKFYNYKSQTTSIPKTYKCQNNVTKATNCTDMVEASLGAYECLEESGNITYYFNTNDSQNRCNKGTKTYVFRTVTTNSTNYYKCNSPYKQQSDCPTVSPLTSQPTGASTLLEATGGFNYYGAAAQTQNKKFYDRITRLKDGMFTVLQGLNGTPQLGNDIVAGLTRFTGGTGGASAGRTGLVLVPSRRLDADASATAGCTGKTQRNCLLDKIKDLDGTDYTPTGRAYAIGARSLLNTIGTDTSICNGNGIYALTDGGPSATTDTNPATEMANTISGFTCPSTWNTDVANINSTFEFKSKVTGANSDNEGVWRCIAKFNNALLEGATSRPKIKTAVVGFGKFYEGLNAYTGHEKNKNGPLTSSNIDVQNILNSYSNISNNYAGTTGGASRADIANTALWGIYGRGGWYAASEPAQVADSILKFVDTVKPTFDPIVTGSPTIPVDALNPIQLQPYGYYATFVPKPQDNMQLWLGNLNKYHIYNGELYDNDKLIQLIQENGLINSAASGIWGAAGMLGKLPLGTFTDPDKNTKSANRVVFTNREMSGTSAIESNSLQQVTLETLFDVNAEKAKFKNDPDKRYWLNILGYQIDATTDISSLTLDTLPTAQQRQMGAVMHSKPILLTQEGKVVATKVSGSATPAITTTGREDYLLFGSNQGMLHVVDIISGKEKFAFVPHEMMNNQKLGFLSEGNTDLGKDHLYYGIDGAWTAYTQYVSKTDGTLTVKSSDRKDYDGNDLNQAGLQWVYGGLRMGGRGYYGLDLSNINAPSLKFHINPMGTGSAEDPTGYMGKSWSKPTIAWVNWGGTRKLVMFVGGGYDDNGEVQCGDSSDATSNPNLSTYDSLNKYNNKGYECPKYNQTNQKGAGVYMFDAGDGSLLWWGSANAASTTSATTNSGVIATKADDLKYSVVSQINAVDRNSDGLVDHLFFGDLGGQAFRVDLNNNATTTGAFAKRVVPLYKGHLANGLSPRFYEMPSFSVHGGGVNGLFGVVALSSGNRSSPLAGTNTVKVAGVDQIVTTPTANDGVYVIYDNDVARTDLYSEITLRTSNVSLPAVTFGQLKAGITQTSGSGVSLAYRGGWNYKFSAEAAGKYKGMNEIYALDGMLYVNVYNKDGTGVTGSCGAGVIGNSELYQFCLPTGRCSFYDNNTSVPNSSVLGVGIIGTGLGQGYSNKGNETGLIIKKDTANHCDNVANKNKPECQLFDNSSKLKQMRWYETQ
ncbi:pilus assembly protein [Acinetobacter johnsonii]|uniref:PilC/PilY family type IV pilus protein n=1 Tax=Acinetobacter johnsonii TaxID=40214 RepID=A0AAW6RRD7_ACIJO|nr:PilC/PilY family type IV pilus protein [Acinetobacter johnsonii]MDG9786956.1 PilC/PilY family type IV pilus protein [Acinetobacter johnsonii]MDG9797934.1 PilC/PilY family type IV pilus protein [Acinetobacter johnsonii]